MNSWFTANGLTLNMDKTNIMKFTGCNHQSGTLQVEYLSKSITGADNIKFLGLELDKNMSWKNHIQLILPKLSSACYLVRKLYPCCELNTIKIIYFAYFHSVMEYGVMFWGASVESKKILQLQKRIIRIMTGSTPRTPCRNLFKELGILTLTSQYVFSLMKFLSSNLEIYKFNESVHGANTRQKLKLHKPSTRPSVYQRGVNYKSISIYKYNRLPGVIAELVTKKNLFIRQLKKYLLDNPVYSLEELFEPTTDS